MDPSLLLGALLVGVGLALAALAYSLITERIGTETESESASESTAGEPADQVEPAASAEEKPDERETQSESEIEREPLPSPAGEAEVVADAVEETDTDEMVEENESDAEELAPAPKQEPPKIRPTFPVATLMRDEVSGQLAIKVGDNVYRSAEELKASKDWSRVHYAVDDLVKWMETGSAEEAPSRRSASPVRQQSSAGETTSDPNKLRSMVEEIDAILQEMLLDTSHTEKAVRLMEGPGGSARVLIGIESYSIDEVPNDEIRDLINQAVAQWEATR